MIKFGPSGNCERFYEEGYKSTLETPLWLKENNLDCFEYSFGRGVTVGEKTAGEIKQAFLKQGIEISVHAPYYINFANPDDEKAKNSYNYLLTSALAGRQMGAKRVIFHPASVGKVSRSEAFLLCLKRIETLTELIYQNNFDDILFCPETMGKLNQIGDPYEIGEICKIDKIFIPTIDFGHLNARTNGSLKTKDDFKKHLEYLIEQLGYERMKHFHAHFSKIEYSLKGEIRHLTFTDEQYGPEFEPLAEALIELKLEPIIICESAGTQADDAIYMKRIYNKIAIKKPLFNA